MSFSLWLWLSSRAMGVGITQVNGFHLVEENSMEVARANTQSCWWWMLRPHEGELGIAPTVSTTETFPYLCVPQCHGAVGVFWTLLGDIGTSEPVGHDQVTPAHLSISLGLFNPSYTLHQEISNISPLLTVDLDHYTIWREGEEIFQIGKNDYTKTQTQHRAWQVQESGRSSV